jgi:hypothetical protein
LTFASRKAVSPWRQGQAILHHPDVAPLELEYNYWGKFSTNLPPLTGLPETRAICLVCRYNMQEVLLHGSPVFHGAGLILGGDQ